MRYAIITAVWLALAAGTHATNVIANWDLIPFQRIDSVFNVGVVAFHETGADVEISVNGILLERITAPTYNDRVDVWEYWTALDPAAYADGPLTLTATAYPDSAGHTARVLDTLTLYANAGGTYDGAIVWADAGTGSDGTGDGSAGNPYATAEKAFVEAGEGGTVYLAAGEYTWKRYVAEGGGYGRWTTITAAPGTDRADVVIEPDCDSVFTQNWVKWQNVTLRRLQDDYLFYFLWRSYCQYMWLEGCDAYSDTANDGISKSLIGSQSSALGLYYSNTTVRDFTSPGGKWTRNCRISNIKNDVWRAQDDLFAVNVHVDNMPDNGLAHRDLIQFYSPGDSAENVILYNLRATNMNCQGYFGGPGRDVAYVNNLLEKVADNANISQINTYEHKLWWHTSVVNLTVQLSSYAAETAWNMRNNVFHGFRITDSPDSTTLPNSVISHNHYGSATQCLGTDYTTGDAGYADPATLGDPYREPDSTDYMLLESSPAYRAGVPLECVPADIDGTPFHPSTPNLGAYAGEWADSVSVIMPDVLQVPERVMGGTLYDVYGRTMGAAGEAVPAGVYFTTDDGVPVKVLVR